MSWCILVNCFSDIEIYKYRLTLLFLHLNVYFIFLLKGNLSLVANHFRNVLIWSTNDDDVFIWIFFYLSLSGFVWKLSCLCLSKLFLATFMIFKILFGH